MTMQFKATGGKRGYECTKLSRLTNAEQWLNVQILGAVGNLTQAISRLKQELPASPDAGVWDTVVALNDLLTKVEVLHSKYVSVHRPAIKETIKVLKETNPEYFPKRRKKKGT